jgi:hypothetical protein
MLAGANKATLTREAKATVALQHYPDGVNSIVVTVNNPPSAAPDPHLQKQPVRGEQLHDRGGQDNPG